MGLAKHFYTARGHGQRVPNYVYRFFEMPVPADNQLTAAERRYTPKKKKVAQKPKKSIDKSMDDILDDLLG